MATVTHRISTASTSNASSYASGTFTPAVGDLLVFFVSATGTTTAAPTLTSTGAGQEYTLVNTALKGSSADRVYCFVSNILSTAAASQTVTFDCTGDAATGAIIQGFSVSGMTRTALNGAVKQSAVQSNQASGTPTITFGATTLTGNVIATAASNSFSTSSTGLTVPGSFTSGNDTGYNTPPTGARYAYRNSGHTSTTVTWGSSSASAFGAVAIELDTTAAPKMSTLQDTFSAGSLDTALWTDDGSSVTQSSGAAHLNADSYGNLGFWSDAWYDLTSSEIVIEVPALPSTDVGDGPFFGITLSSKATNDPTNYRIKWFYYSTSAGVGDWTPQYQNSGASSDGTGVTSDSSNRWLRIKHDGTNILWDTSPDGTTWTNKRSIAASTVAVPYTAMRVSFAAGADAATTGTFDVSAVNVTSVTNEGVGALAVTAAPVSAADATHEALAVRATTAALVSAATATHEATASLAATAALVGAATVTEAVWDAVGTLAVTATSSAGAAAVHEAAAALAVTSAQVAAATATHEATASLATTAALVAAATVTENVAEAVGTLAVTATLVAAATATHEATASLAATAALTSAATVTENVAEAVGALVVTASPVAAATATHEALASLAVTEAGVAAATVTENVAEAVGTLAVTARLAASATATHEASAALAVTEAGVAAVTRDVPAVASLAVLEAAQAAADHTAEATAELDVTVFTDAAAEGVDAELEAEGDLPVTAELSAVATVTTSTTAAAVVTTALASEATRSVEATASLPVTAAVTSAVDVTHEATASLSITEVGTSAATTEAGGTEQSATGALSVTAGLTSAAAVTRPAAAPQTVTAGLSASAERGRNADAASAVSAALAAEAEVIRAAEAVLAGLTHLTASAVRNVTAESALNVTAETAALAVLIDPDAPSDLDVLVSDRDLDIDVSDRGVLTTVGGGPVETTMEPRGVDVLVGAREI